MNNPWTDIELQTYEAVSYTHLFRFQSRYPEYVPAAAVPLKPGYTVRDS